MVVAAITNALSTCLQGHMLQHSGYTVPPGAHTISLCLSLVTGFWAGSQFLSEHIAVKQNEKKYLSLPYCEISLSGLNQTNQHCLVWRGIKSGLSFLFLNPYSVNAVALRLMIYLCFPSPVKIHLTVSRSHFPNNASSTAVSITRLWMKATPGGSETNERHRARKYSSMHVCMEALECAHSRNGDGGKEVEGRRGAGGGGRIRSIVYTLKYSSFLWILGFSISTFLFICLFI